MTPKELSKKVSELDDPTKFDDLSLTVKIVDEDSRTINGLLSIFEFAYNQSEGWNKFNNLPATFNLHKEFFKDIISLLEYFFTSKTGLERRSIKVEWSQLKNRHYINIGYNRAINIDTTYFLYTHPAIPFLIDVYNKYSNDIFKHSYDIIINEPNNKRNRDRMLGEILAYEFINKDSDITERRKQEKKSLNELRNELSKSLEGSKERLNEFIGESKNKVQEFSLIIDKLKGDKTEIFDVWYNGIKESYTKWDISTKEKINDLEKTYQEKLRLSEPVKYWNKRADDLRKRGNKARGWLIGLIIISVLFLSTYICIAPSGLITNIVKGNTDSMKWLLVSITIISFLAYGIRSFNKVMFSSYHLARDAEEREQLTYVYLALYNDNKIDEKERSIVLQALFSRADTGLLKEDSSPTMPGTIIEKFTSH